MMFEEFWNSRMVPQSMTMMSAFEYAKPIAKAAYQAGRDAAIAEAAEVADNFVFPVDRQMTISDAIHALKEEI